MFFQRGVNGLADLLYRLCPSNLEQLFRATGVSLAQKLFSWRPMLIGRRPRTKPPIRVICISDTQTDQPSNIPPGEILIHAGDATQSGTLKEFQSCIDWLQSFPHPHKIIIGGDHDILLDPSIASPAMGRLLIEWGDVIYLNREAVTLQCSGGRKLRVYGSPLTPRHGNGAFQYPPEQNIWAVPYDVDILITHGPPKGHLDFGNVGCNFLLEELWKTRPRLHVFGHVHESYGQEWVVFDRLQKEYEEVIKANGGGIRRLARLIYEFVIISCQWPPTEASTILINASMVGGNRDEERRQAVTVYV